MLKVHAARFVIPARFSMYTFIWDRKDIKKQAVAQWSARQLHIILIIYYVCVERLKQIIYFVFLCTFLVFFSGRTSKVLPSLHYWRSGPCHLFFLIIAWNRFWQFFLFLPNFWAKGSRKKSSSTNGQAIKALPRA